MLERNRDGEIERREIKRNRNEEKEIEGDSNVFSLCR